MFWQSGFAYDSPEAWNAVHKNIKRYFYQTSNQHEKHALLCILIFCFIALHNSDCVMHLSTELWHYVQDNAQDDCYTCLKCFRSITQDNVCIPFQPFFSDNVRCPCTAVLLKGHHLKCLLFILHFITNYAKQKGYLKCIYGVVDHSPCKAG